MQNLRSLEEIDAFIDTQELTLLYISKEGCSVCHSLLPQIEALLENYPGIHTAHIESTEVPEVAGRFSIFAVPVILVFVKGKEYLREARIVHMDLFEERLNKLYKNMVE
ncbi:thioredoxin family protein [Oceanobacillus manasiensis]|uniref:thioredoxin family protein n=1 Tax=Oceanobacillus manasiensis TaxID=586413 RepID=UPI0005A9AF60|nr:thioredoxin family protein [Oceanobacillus manasiensis]